MACTRNWAWLVGGALVGAAAHHLYVAAKGKTVLPVPAGTKGIFLSEDGGRAQSLGYIDAQRVRGNVGLLDVQRSKVGLIDISRRRMTGNY